MLRTLRIRNLVILEDISLEFGSGLNVLTGETGAGKSILVDALGLIAGARADLSMIRPGSGRALVEASIEPPPTFDTERFLEERGIPDNDGLLLVRRELSGKGGGRVFINDSPCALSTLRQASGELLDLLGQAEHRTLLSRESHRVLLDRFAGLEDRARSVGERWRKIRDLQDELERRRRLGGEREERSESLRRAIGEIETVDPVPGEMETIDRRRNVLRNAGRVAELVEAAASRLYTDERSASFLAGSAARALEELAELDPELAELHGRVENARVEIEDAGASLRDYLERTDFDPDNLERIEKRKTDLERLRSRYGRDEREILEYLDEARRDLQELQDLESESGKLEGEIRRQEARYFTECAGLTRARREASAKFGKAVERQLADLAMGAARFEAGIVPARGPSVTGSGGKTVPGTAHGGDAVEFMLASNPGEGSRPLADAASGGELSRVMLALHGVVEGAAAGRTTVFDEVDAGIGGAVADAVGRRLTGIARTGQVLCVTHLPQVAAYADRHYSVRKRVRDGRTRAEVRELDRRLRVEELARMLGGEKITEASRNNAEELIRQAGRRGS